MDTGLFIDNDNITISVPLMKVDQKNRTVEGFATLDNEDKTGDVVDFDASKRAFAMWPGNVREMHQKIAVGKAVSTQLRKYTDDYGNTYDGIWVRAKISKGAGDTWEKVLDGTLNGFSIGGAIRAKKQELSKTSGASINRITEYVLTELSLVDNPANHLATISLVKSVNGDVIMGEALDNEINYEELIKNKYSPDQFKEMVGDGEAMPGNRYPIKDVEDLKNAINDTRAQDNADAAVWTHIRSRANVLGRSDLLNKNNEGGKMEEELEKAAGGDPIKGKHEAINHLDHAYGHVQAYADHVRDSDHPSRDDHAASAIDTAGNIARLKRSAQYQAEPYTPETPKHPMAKGEEGENLQENEISDISSLNNLSTDEKGLLRKFFDFIKGNSEVSEPIVKTEETKEQENLEKDSGGDTPDMTNEEMNEAIEKATTGLGESIAKSLDEKLTQIAESLVKVDQRFENVATTNAVSELKTELEGVVGRVAALEESGAVKKSADKDAPKDEEIEKSDGGFWGDSIVPEFLQKRFKGV